MHATTIPLFLPPSADPGANGLEPPRSREGRLIPPMARHSPHGGFAALATILLLILTIALGAFAFGWPPRTLTDRAAPLPAVFATPATPAPSATEETLLDVTLPLELVPTTHPNDLYAGEAAKFRFLLDGKPVPGLAVQVIAGGTRYRDAPQPMNFKTDKDGAIAITWPASGLYWLDAVVEDDKATVPNVKKRRATYNATLEVLPQ